MKTPCLVIALLVATLFSCKKHVITPPVNQLSLLPPATQTGANTFGCLINGQAYLPSGNVFSGSAFQCYYQYTSGGFYFTVAASNKGGSSLVKDLVVRTDSLAINQGEVFTLQAFVSGNATASYTLFNQADETQYSTTNAVLGKLIISKLDTIKQIVSGTFYFNAIRITGDTVKVTNGRFDAHYTL